MLNFKKTLVILLLGCVFYSSGKGQGSADAVERERRWREEQRARQRQEADLNRQFKELNELANPTVVYVRPAPRVPVLSREERARIKAMLAPDAEDAAKYKDFLRQKNTGLIRLFPDFDCEAKNVIRVGGNCANLVPGSWNYSFRLKNYSDADYFDLRLRNGNLISESFLSQGILVRLGDVPLESVSALIGGLKFLLGFEPQVQSVEAKKQFAQIANGVQADGFKYAKSVRAEKNMTYALRVVAYRTENKVANRLSANASAGNSKFINLNFADKRIDLTVAFRIVRRDADGNITILWKELNRREAPKIVFSKSEKLSDIKP
ncbi:MAG: hypothetical protein H0U87_02215 [Acidobacteria bacterium]|nr:hypothetical protein [Acidobacteriota bacterium]